MKYLLFICLLATACSSARKTASLEKENVERTSTILRDSIGKRGLDSAGIQSLLGATHITIDSGYDKVIEEKVSEDIDSNVIHRQIIRTIKERGQKRTEQSAEVIQKDSSAKHIQEQAAIKQVQKQDSLAAIVTKNKQVKRVTLLPWWIWVIAAVVLVGVLWWKKNSIIDLFI